MSNVVAIPKLLTERDTAERIGISLSTLQRLRKTGRIECLRIGRRVKYTEHQILDYLEACKCREKPAPHNSENTISPNALTHLTGAEPGSIQKRDRQNAKVLALKTLRKQQSSSKAGLSNTANNQDARANK